MSYEDETYGEPDNDEEEAELLIYGKRFSVGPSYEREEELQSIRTMELLRDLVEDAEVDERTGEVIIRTTTAPHNIEITERFQSIEEIRDFFEGLGFFQSPVGEGLFGYGAALTIDPREAAAVLEESNMAALFTIAKEKGETIFKAPYGLLVPEVRLHLASLNEELIRCLASHPQLLYTLEPRRFEELVAELLRDLGYEVIVTPRSRDGGFDIRAVHKNSVGTLLYLVECKRYRPERPVGVEIVRSLYGVATAERASCGVLATTSYFTAGAREFASKARYQLSLRDYDDLVGWLERYPRTRRR